MVRIVALIPVAGRAFAAMPVSACCQPDTSIDTLFRQPVGLVILSRFKI